MGAQPITVSNPHCTMTTIKALQAETLYQFAVVAHNAHGGSEESIWCKPVCPTAMGALVFGPTCYGVVPAQTTFDFGGGKDFTCELWVCFVGQPDLLCCPTPLPRYRGSTGRMKKECPLR